MAGNGAVDIMSLFNKAQNDTRPQNSVAAFFQQAQAAEVDRNMRSRQTQQQTIDSLEQIENQLRQTNVKKSPDSNNSPLAVFINSNNLNGGAIKSTTDKTLPPGLKQQTEKKLITPEMLKTTNNSSKPKPAPTQETPLTKNQLLQALNHLMDNDEEFVTKVHDAYLKSFKSNNAK